ncbi:MAG: radical SAM protein [Bacteroidales bacterium]|nr:radical SAM protein [Bacteroidales bacterium]
MKTKELIFKKLTDAVISQKQLRYFAIDQLDKYMFNEMVIKYDGTDDHDTQLARYHFYSALSHSVQRNLDKEYISNNAIMKLKDTLIGNTLIRSSQDKIKDIHIKYKEKYGEYPPNFITLSPTQRCNLQCTGCYAASNENTSHTLPYNIVDKIVSEVYNIFGNKFIVISGGEPFMYKSNGKTLIDLFEKYSDVFFLVYTNGTLINSTIAKKLAVLGNVTAAISVEGYNKETDKRRGKGVHDKILHAMAELRAAGVPFGISVTATTTNVDLLFTEEFYDYYFDELGATYMWQFQFMPIGKGNNILDLVVSPENRVKLYKIWERIVKEKKYPLADFWNNAILSNGCIAYGNDSGYLYIDWNGNIMPCVFVPYYVDNVYDLYKSNKTLADATLSCLMQRGRKWKSEYRKNNYNKLMPCSIRDHYKNFRENILTKNSKPENKQAAESLKDENYYQSMVNYDDKLTELTEKINKEKQSVLK